MTTLADFTVTDLNQQIYGPGLVITVGPFSIRVRSTVPEVSSGLHLFYEQYSLVDDADFSDFHIGIEPSRGLRRWYRAQVNFSFDGYLPFKPLPKDQAFAFFEWGLNWCITSHAHQYLIIHAAVVEKEGFAAILPAPPGSGKSTLCAGLVSRGWRLLSDELTLVPVDCLNGSDQENVIAIPRPISLKNESIDVMRRFAPQELIGSVVWDTAKGSVAHMRAPADSVKRSDEMAQSRWIIFPKFKLASQTNCESRTKARSFMEIAQQSFNFNVLGNTGFNILENLISRCDCYDFTYSNLDEAVDFFDSLAAQNMVGDVENMEGQGN